MRKKRPRETDESERTPRRKSLVMDLIMEVAHGCMEQGDAKFSKLQDVKCELGKFLL